MCSVDTIVADSHDGLKTGSPDAYLDAAQLETVRRIIEGKPPELMKDWRFLFVGVRWWLAKMRGRV